MACLCHRHPEGLASSWLLPPHVPLGGQSLHARPGVWAELYGAAFLNLFRAIALLLVTAVVIKMVTSHTRTITGR